jgi:hypothetical protein
MMGVITIFEGAELRPRSTINVNEFLVPKRGGRDTTTGAEKLLRK